MPHPKDGSRARTVWEGLGRPAGLARTRQDFLRRSALQIALFLADVAAAVTAFGIGFLISTLYRLSLGREAHVLSTWLSDRGPELSLILLLMVSLFAFGGLYSRLTWEAEEVRRIFFATGLLALFDVAFQFMFKDHSSRLWFFIAWPMFAVFAVFFRAAVRSLPPLQRVLKSRVMLLGSAFEPSAFEYQLRESQANPVEVIDGLSIHDLKEMDATGLAWVITAKAGMVGISPGRVRIVLAPDAEERPHAERLAGLLEALGVPFLVALPEDVPARRGLQVHRIAGLDAVLGEYEYPGFTLADRLLKRVMDLVLTIPAIIVLSPLFLGLTLILTLEGGRPFFVQRRVGRGGQRFGCFKFRSMWVDAEARLERLLAADPAAAEEWRVHQKLAKDPRITPIGALLRQSSLDELPQLFNILLGQMSLVGPRPIVAPELPAYPADRAYYQSPSFRHYTACVPGLTGLWQVSGRSKTSHTERVRLDAWYTKNWSIWLDIAILFKTVRVLLISRAS